MLAMTTMTISNASLQCQPTAAPGDAAAHNDDDDADDEGGDECDDG